MFVFPMAIMNISLGKDISVLVRPDFIVRPLFKAFRPYLAASGLVILAWMLQMETVDYGQLSSRGILIVALTLLANISVQFFAIVAMRAIGLFSRHYSCYLPHLHESP